MPVAYAFEVAVHDRPVATAMASHVLADPVCLALLSGMMGAGISAHDLATLLARVVTVAANSLGADEAAN